MLKKIFKIISNLTTPKNTTDDAQANHFSQSSENTNPKVFVHPDPEFKYVEQFLTTAKDFLTEKTDHVALDEILATKKYGSEITEELMGFLIDSYIRDHVEKGVMRLTIEKGEVHMANFPDIREGAKQTAKQIATLKEQGIIVDGFGEDFIELKNGIAEHIFANYVLSQWINQNITKTIHQPKECLIELFLGNTFADSGIQRGQMRNTFMFSLISYARAHQNDKFMNDKATQIPDLEVEDYPAFIGEVVERAPVGFSQRLLAPAYSK